MVVYFAISNEEVLAFSKDRDGLESYISGVENVDFIEKNLTESFYKSVTKSSLSLGNNLYAFSKERKNFHKDLLEVSEHLSSSLKVLSRYMKDPALSKEYKDACQLIMAKVNRDFREVCAKMDNSGMPKTKEDMAKAVVGTEMVQFLEENNFEWNENIQGGKPGWSKEKIKVPFNGAQTESFESLRGRFATLHKSGI